MTAPTGLFALGLTLRPEHPPERRKHVAHLAGRLGYASVWVPAGEPPPTVDHLRDLAEGALPARVGVVMPAGPVEPAVLRAFPPTVRIELDPQGPLRPAAIQAVGGPKAWRSRVLVRGFDGESAGIAVLGGDREGLHAALAAAVAARADGRRSAADFPVTAVLAVSIGRTAREAEARALRDPAFEGTWMGLFGTLERAQEQALALRRAGADAIRATLADEHDLADVLAQLRAVTVGPTPVLHDRG